METKYVVKGENNLYLTYTGYQGGAGMRFDDGERVLFDTHDAACNTALANTDGWFSVETVYRKVN